MLWLDLRLGNKQSKAADSGASCSSSAPALHKRQQRRRQASKAHHECATRAAVPFLGWHEQLCCMLAISECESHRAGFAALRCEVVLPECVLQIVRAILALGCILIQWVEVYFG